MNTDRTVLEGAMWARTRPMLPGKATDPGVTAAVGRMFLEAVLWRIRTGSPWRDLPEHFGKEAHLQALPQMGACRNFRDCSGRAPDEFDLEHIFVDGTIVQAHQKAAGAKGGPADRGSDAPGAA